MMTEIPCYKLAKNMQIMTQHTTEMYIVKNASSDLTFWMTIAANRILW